MAVASLLSCSGTSTLLKASNDMAILRIQGISLNYPSSEDFGLPLNDIVGPVIVSQHVAKEVVVNLLYIDELEHPGLMVERIDRQTGKSAAGYVYESDFLELYQDVTDTLSVGLKQPHLAKRLHKWINAGAFQLDGAVFEKTA